VTMRAFRLVSPQETRVCEVPVPEPGPGEVLVKVAGAGLCHSDLHLMHAPALPNCPLTFGHETAGWVERCGAGVSGLEQGEAVLVHGVWGCGLCRYCQTDREQFCERFPGASASCGLGADGGIAACLLVPAARNLVPLGDLDPVDAGPLDDAALTPYHVISKHRARLVPGAAAVVIGVGGLGHMAIQLLREVGAARIVAIDTDESKLEFARELGAEVAVTSGESTVEEVREALGGRGAALVLDLVGKDSTLGLAMQLAEPEAHVACVGAALGSIQWSFLTAAFDATLGNSFWGTRGELHEIVALAQSGKIRVHAEHFALEDTGKAYELLEAGRVRGRAIVTP
jgi:propanol-preferring alcohol dehydrogenase